MNEKQPSLDRIVVVLSHTTEPGNIGSVCRAMKTMGLTRLRLINPLTPKGRTARAFAHGATEILERAEVVPDLMTAIGDAQIVAGTTARKRQLRKHALLSPAELADRLVPRTADNEVVLLFGTERTGLTNDEIDICRYLSTVETAQPQPSLNLAMAVMLYAWEIRQRYVAVLAETAGNETQASPQPEPRARRDREFAVRHPHRSTKLPSQFDLDTMYGHLAHAMSALDYTEHERRKFLTYLRQLHMRAGIVDWEMQIYHLLARRILELAGAPRFRGL